MKTWIRGTICGIALFGLAVLLSGAATREHVREFAADHRDSPLVIIDPAADICDMYIFKSPSTDPADADKVVLAMTVNPFQAPGNNQFFSPNVLYQFKIDNQDKKGNPALDNIEDTVIQFTFTKADTDQQFTMVGPAPTPKAGVVSSLIKQTSKTIVIKGPANGTEVDGTSNAAGIKVFCGLRDDPFFFDLLFGEKAGCCDQRTAA